MLGKDRINSKLAQDIEEDMNELDKTSPARSKKSTVKSEPCPDCSESLMGPGLLDEHTLCQTCQGTGKVAVLD